MTPVRRRASRSTLSPCVHAVVALQDGCIKCTIRCRIPLLLSTWKYLGSNSAADTQCMLEAEQRGPLAFASSLKNYEPEMPEKGKIRSNLSSLKISLQTYIHIHVYFWSLPSLHRNPGSGPVCFGQNNAVLDFFFALGWFLNTT